MSTVAAPMPQTAKERFLPPLRDELSLHKGAPLRHGSPSWLLYDPVAYRYFRIGWLEIEIISRWNLGTVEKVLQAIHAQTLLQPHAEDVLRVAEFLHKSNLLKAFSAADTERFLEYKKNTRQHAAAWLLKNYLFFRIPLIRPEALLQKLLPKLRVLFHRRSAFFVGFMALLGLYLISREWTFFRQTASELLTPEGALLAAGALILVKIVHEFGHGLTATYYGCRVPTMGIAFMVFCPVLWTDTTETWRLQARQKRLAVVAAGMLTELAVAALASVLWFLLPDGPWRTGVYILAAVAWVMSLAINANPFMRYDGYYLLADFLEIPDLQARSFALAKWRLREFLFRFADPRPYTEEKGRERFLIAFALATWLYRFFLFFGIALMVYTLFFKALGALLMAVELGWFIALPVYKECQAWTVRLRTKGLHKIPWGALLVLGSLFFLFFFPWQHRVFAPGMLLASKESVLYSPEEGQISQIMVHEGTRVAPEEPLIVLTSDSLAKNIRTTELQLTEIQHRLELDALSSELARFTQADLREQERLLLTLHELQRKQKALTIRAPFAGRLTEVQRWIRPGNWVAADTPLARIVAGPAEVIAYVPETDLPFLNLDGQGLFYSRDGVQPAVPLRITRIDAVHVTQIKHPQLTAPYGGAIAVTSKNGHKLLPERTLYKITCRVPEEHLPPTQALPGRAVLECQGRSLAVAIWYKLRGLIARETGL